MCRGKPKRTIGGLRMSLPPSPKGSARTLPVRTRLERRDVVLGTAGLLALAIFVLRQATSGAADDLAFVYVVPVALVALELGPGAGVAAAVASLALVAVWMATRDTPVGLAEALAQAIVFLTIGAICGRFSGRMQAARERHRQLLDSGLALSEPTEPGTLGDVIADRALELAPARGVRVTFDAVAPIQIGELTGDMLSFKMRGGDSDVGLIEIAAAPSRPFTGDERLALEVLAIQAAAAAERQRLLALQRGQATLHAELSAAHGRLAEQGTRLESVLVQQEQERRDLAEELQEEAAQTLAAVQLGLAAVERDLGSQPSRAQVETLRSSLADTSRTLRDLAIGLRPPTLDDLGLRPALLTLAQRASARSGYPVDLDLNGIEYRLPPSLESAVYRLVDDIISGLAPAPRLRIRLERSPGQLRILALRSGGDRSLVPRDLQARMRARLDLAGGLLTVDETGGEPLVATIPIPEDQLGGSSPEAPADRLRSRPSR